MEPQTLDQDRALGGDVRSVVDELAVLGIGRGGRAERKGVAAEGGRQGVGHRLYSLRDKD